MSSPSSRAVYKRTIAIARTKTQVQSPLNQVRSTPIPAELESPAARGAQERTTGRVDGGPVDFSDEENYLVEEAEHESLYVEPHDDSPGNGSEASESKFIEGDDTNIHESEAEEDHLEEEESPSVAAKAASRGRKRKNAPDEAELSEPQEDVPAPKSRRGPKPKTAQAELNKPDQLKENSRPTKRPKTTTTRERKTELQMSAEQEKELGQVIDKLTKRDGPLKQRSLHILRREDPEDDAVRHTRSGRASVRPLAYWRNEKCVYGAGEAELGQRFPVSTIKEIIRIDEPEPVYTKSGKKVSKRKKSKAKKRRDESSDEEEDDAEPWEADPGVFYGPVKMWDPELQAGTQEEEIMGTLIANLSQLEAYTDTYFLLNRRRLRSYSHSNSGSQRLHVPFC